MNERTANGVPVKYVIDWLIMGMCGILILALGVIAGLTIPSGDTPPPAVDTPIEVGYSGSDDRPTRTIEVTVKVTPFTDSDSVYLVAQYDPVGDKTVTVPNPHIADAVAVEILEDLKYIAQQASLSD